MCFQTLKSKNKEHILYLQTNNKFNCYKVQIKILDIIYIKIEILPLKLPNYLN
jgi:hypothetical protein